LGMTTSVITLLVRMMHECVHIIKILITHFICR
jgi:hypothetical protein